MNRWRIGSISMGLILIALGVLMLVSLVTTIDMFITITTLWPIIMICLGLEILLFLFIKKGDDIKIRYDVLSIFFIGFILTVSVLFFAATSFIDMLFDSRDEMRHNFGIGHNREVCTICRDW
jgi:amino acid permease